MASIASALIPAAIQTGGAIATAEIVKPQQPKVAPQPPSLSQSLGLNGIPQWGLILGGIAILALLVVLVRR